MRRALLSLAVLLIGALPLRAQTADEIVASRSSQRSSKTSFNLAP